MRQRFAQSVPTRLRRGVGVVVRVAGLGLVLGALPGCQGVMGVVPMTEVRIIDASPDAQGLDIYQGGAAVAYNVGFGTVTSYVSLSPGTTTISANTTGTKQQLSSVKGTFAVATQYTVLVGNVAAGLSETILTDQSVAAPSGNVSIRILNQATRYSGGVDVYLVPSGSTLVGAAPIVTNAVFETNSGYINVPAGAYSVVLLKTGTVPVAATIPIYSGAKVSYSAGAARTLILLDEQVIANPGFQVITADDYDSPSATS